MNIQPASLFDLDFFEPLPIHDRDVRRPAHLRRRPAAAAAVRRTHRPDRASSPQALDDPRDPDLIDHSFLEMVRCRVFGILAGYEDQNDHDTLRTDPVFKLIADRSPDDPDLASQPTLSRFENQINIALAETTA